MTRTQIFARRALLMGSAALLALGAELGAAWASDDAGHADGAHGKQITAGGQAESRGHVGGGKGQSMKDLFRTVTGETESDGGPSGIHGGGKPAVAGVTRGDLFGDLYVILRDDNGVPILSEEGFVQPVDAEGVPIALDDEGAPIDPTLAIEVEIGRLNVGRAPTSVLDRRADEVVAVLNAAEAITVDAAGRLVFTIDGVEKTIDSPLENLAIYVALLTTGTIPRVDDLPGEEYDFLVDGELTAEDLAASTAFLAAATDKTGAFSIDEIAYIDAFLGIGLESSGDVTWSFIDYSDFTYDRESVYGDVTATVLVEVDGVWTPTDVSIFEAVFDNEQYADETGGIDVYTQAADDARELIEFIHEYAVPLPSGL